MNKKVIQLIEPAKDEREASAMLSFCRTQVNSIGGRVLPASNSKPARCQAFFSDEPEINDDGLAFVGLRRVTVWPSLFSTLGIS